MNPTKSAFKLGRILTAASFAPLSTVQSTSIFTDRCTASGLRSCSRSNAEGGMFAAEGPLGDRLKSAKGSPGEQTNVASQEDPPDLLSPKLGVHKEGAIASTRTSIEHGAACAASEVGNTRFQPYVAGQAVASMDSLPVAARADIPVSETVWDLIEARNCPRDSNLTEASRHHDILMKNSEAGQSMHREPETVGVDESREHEELEPSEPILWYPRRDPGRLPPHVTFYKRELAYPCIAFSSTEGKRLWQEALLDGTADCYFKLSEQFITQAEPAYCGLTSLAMVLNALEIDPRRTWKGVWRWFVEDLLITYCDGSPLQNVEQVGVTFAQVVDLAQCNGAMVDAMSYDLLTLELFRDVITEVCAQDEKFLIISYCRRHLNQSGDGHFSPIGGYNANSDMVLILDVARFKYPPHWVPLKELFHAMSFHDPETSKPRGAILLSRSPHAKSVLFNIDTDAGNSSCSLLMNFLEYDLPRMAAEKISSAAGRGKGGCSLAFNLPQLLGAMVVDDTPSDVLAQLSTRLGPSCSQKDFSCAHHQAMQHLLVELRALPLFTAIRERLSAAGSHGRVGGEFLEAERLALLLLLAPPSTWAKIPSQYRAAVVEMLNPSSGKWAMKLVASEVEYLQQQLNDVKNRQQEQPCI